MEKKKADLPVVKYILITGAVVLGIRYFDVLVKALGSLWSIASPLVLGGAMAYVLNIIMKQVEKIYFPHSKSRVVQKTRRMVSILVAILLIVGILVLVMTLVVPELIKAFTVVGSAIPTFLEDVQNWIMSYEDQIPSIVEWVEGLEMDWNSTIKNIITYATTGVGGLLNSTVTIVGAVTGGITNFVVSLIFAIYILASKEKLAGQFGRLLDAYLKKERVKKIRKVLTTADQTFSNFIVGQCTEAVILGTLCTVGMLIFRFPYAPMVGAFLGVTALIPIVGAFLGAGVGAFMILTVDPMKALLFVIFIIVLQQLEGNLIYPKVVGSSIGLPGIWVLAGVTVGGGLCGIFGMLLGVPLTATIYKLLKMNVRARLGAEGREVPRL